ncbi:MAG: 30S ribosomal protein S6 [Candidatus Ryanbacteria bacterium]|nr:30S ribosomal protein S6 [Candidatus Ryanbacteria bacterium]
MAQELEYYELTYLLPPSISEEEATSIAENLKSLLGSYSAEIDSWDSPRKRFLAYHIQREKEAYVGALRFTAGPEQAGEIKEKAKMRKPILRTMLMKWQKEIPRQKPVRPSYTPKPELEVPTDEQALDRRLEEILGDLPHESQ